MFRNKVFDSFLDPWLVKLNRMMRALSFNGIYTSAWNKHTPKSKKKLFWISLISENNVHIAFYVPRNIAHCSVAGDWYRLIPKNKRKYVHYTIMFSLSLSLTEKNEWKKCFSTSKSPSFSPFHSDSTIWGASLSLFQFIAFCWTIFTEMPECRRNIGEYTQYTSE